MSSQKNRFFILYVICSIISFSPFKILSYFSPLLFISFYFFTTFDKFVFFKKILIIFIIFIFFLILNLFIQKNFVIQNYILAFLTYSTIYPIFLIDNKEIASTKLLKKILKFNVIVVAIESIWGIIQAVYGFTQTGSFGSSNGDYVEGTIHPTLNPELAFSNPMFAVNMILLSLGFFTYCYFYNQKGKIWFYLGIISIILASVVHTIIYIFLSIVFSIIIIKPTLRNLSNSFPIFKRKIRYSIVLIIFIMAIFFIGDNFALLPHIASEMIYGEYPRALVTLNVIEDLPKEVPLSPIIGIGLGQFSSRASLIGSGLYLGGIYDPRSAPFLDNKINPLADEYIITLLEKWSDADWLGSTQQPNYSILSIYSETGLIGLVLFLIFIYKVLIKVNNVAKKNTEKKNLSFIFFSGTIFIFLLGFQENYYEIPQAILLGVLILKVIYSIIVYENKNAA